MTERILVDNDVIIKIALWQLERNLIACTSLDGVPPAMLGVARYVVASRLAKATKGSDRKAAEAFEALQAEMLVIEPNDEEIADAADFEAQAATLGVDLDPGESQLLAILRRRGCDLLLTGDKRAVCAIELVVPDCAAGKIACLEQLIAEVIRKSDSSTIIRARVCAKPNADRAITVCFACSSLTTSAQVDIHAGLVSYIEDLRRRATTVLLPGADLSALTA